MSNYKIPLYKPCIGDLEKKLVNEALDTGWVSSRGKFVEIFESKFAEYCNRKYALTVCNGTAALHLALEALELKKGTGVICPTLTYVSTANAIRYAGLIPIFVDCDETGVSEYEQIKKGLDVAKKNNLEVSCILPVHLYGVVPNILEIKKLSIPIIDDCAESLGSELNNKKSGSEDTEFSCFSFFGNKTITTGEGGMIVSNNEDLISKALILRSVGQMPSSTQRYLHVKLGYNYRLTNVACAIGIGQLSKIDDILNKKRKIANIYKNILIENGLCYYLLPEPNNLNSNYWLVTIKMKSNIMREGLIIYLESKGIETRPAFLPIHAMVNLGESYRVSCMKNSEEISSCSISLPSFSELTENEVNYICQNIIDYCKNF